MHTAALALIASLFTAGMHESDGSRVDEACPDVRATSASGKYCFESVNPHPEASGSCTGFTVRLFDAITGAVVWERVQGAEEHAALQAWVSDGGRVVVDAGAYHLLGAQDGVSRYSWDPSASLNEADRKYIQKRATARGEQTNESLLAHHFIMDFGKGFYFVTRYFWGKYTFIDLTSGQALGDPGDALVHAADNQERRFVRVTLKSAVPVLAAVEQWDQAACEGNAELAREVERAAFLAGQLGVREVVPDLRKLEGCGYFEARTASAVGREWPGHPAARLFPLRRAAHTALRRLGERPGIHESYTLVSSGPGWRAPELRKARERGRLATWVKPGMRAEEIFEQAGAPDWGSEAKASHDAGREVVWEYDIDGPPASTLQVYFGSDGAVTRVENARRPTWQEGFQRDVGDW